MLPDCYYNEPIYCFLIDSTPMLIPQFAQVNHKFGLSLCSALSFPLIALASSSLRKCNRRCNTVLFAMHNEQANVMHSLENREIGSSNNACSSPNLSLVNSLL